MNKIFAGSSILLFILILGTSGYMQLEDIDFTDALFMTVISITTVGFSEVFPLSAGSKFFTIFLIFGGVGLFFYFVSMITEVMVEGGLQSFLGRMRHLSIKLSWIQGSGRNMTLSL